MSDRPSQLPKIGEKEGQGLEFKRAEVLRSNEGRRKLLREVVAMLNSEAGGRILVGLAEEKGAFTGLDPLGEEDRQFEDNLRDALLDAIEPRIQDAECRLDWVPVPGGLVLELQVRPRIPAPVPPFCLRHGEKRVYLMRCHDRIRPMSYDDLRNRVAEGDDGSESWFQEVTEKANSWFDVEERPSYFLLLGLQPRDGSKEVRLPEDSPQVVNHPPQEIAPPQGWTFVTAFGGSAKWARGGRELRSGDPESGYREIRADHTGVFAFRTLLHHLQWDVPENWRGHHPDAPGMLYPYALVDSTVSVLRLAAKLWEEHLHDADLHASLRLTHTKGWLLPPYRPNTIGYHMVESWHATREEEITSGPHRMAAEAFAERPDALAFQLLTDVYAEFDYWPKHIPCFDPATGRWQAP